MICAFANRLLTIAGAAVAFGLAGCANAIPLEIDFPNETAVLISSNADIRLFPVTEGDLDRCSTLLTTPSSTGGTLVGSIPICDLRSYTLPDPGGPVAILVRVLDDTNSEILAGCAIADVYPGRGVVHLELFPTDDYLERLERDPPVSGASLEVRCGGSS